MLKLSKVINITGFSTIQGVSESNSGVIENYNASIDESEPDNINMSSFISDQKAYKENKEQCRQDRSEFEDAVYKIQDELISKKGDV